MDLYLRKIARILTILLLFMVIACSEDDKTTNPINYKNALSATISGDVNMNFSAETFLPINQGEIISFAGTNKNGDATLNILFDDNYDNFSGIFTDDSDSSNIVMYYSDSGALSITKDNSEVIEGTFIIDSLISISGWISITGGKFTYYK